MGEGKALGPKDTSYDYGRSYQLNQANKYRNRHNNSWKERIALVFNMFEKYIAPIHQSSFKKDIVVVDVGCSIGTFAIEFSKLGYDSYGIDFDREAVEIARGLAKEEEVSPEFICGDISEWTEALPPIDVAVCSDIFEHLHDDELGAFLSSIRKQLSDHGSLVFHTFPTQYDYIFYTKARFLLLPFRVMSQSGFNKVVKTLALLIDIALIFKRGMVYKERIKRDGHCNPLSKERLIDILNRAGFELDFIETSNLYDIEAFPKKIHEQFRGQSSSFMNLYGVAHPKQKKVL